jgi:hypothetical protein
MKNLFYIFISNLGIFPLILTCDIVFNQQTNFDTENKTLSVSVTSHYEVTNKNNHQYGRTR